MDCLVCHQLNAMYKDCQSYQCRQCGWIVKMRKYSSFREMIQTGQKLSDIVLWNTAINRHKSEVRRRVNLPQEGDSDVRCPFCHEFMKLCGRCHQVPVGRCRNCGWDNPQSSNPCEYCCGGYGCD